jgi:hypothetical protein
MKIKFRLGNVTKIQQDPKGSSNDDNTAKTMLTTLSKKSANYKITDVGLHILSPLGASTPLKKHYWRLRL